jgi:hypothetical protein
VIQESRQKRLVEQLRNYVDKRWRTLIRFGRYRLGGVESEGANKERQPAKNRLFVL